jgi:L-threonylcarbamoyladenylate synthase
MQMTESSVAEAVDALRAGQPIVLPTDTVYGLAVSPYRDEHARRLYKLKGRDDQKPIALVGTDLDWILECVPELRGRAGVIARALLPGPYTLVLPNPSRRYRWLTGSNPEAIGVRVPEATGPGAEVLAKVGVVAATSANVAGGPDPARLEDVPEPILEGVAAAVDGGELPGTPSTVLDFTGGEPRVLREGAAPSAEALARVREALAS